jgi:hypothetical protein
MHFILSAPRYISNINYSKDAPDRESFVFEAVIDSPYELIAVDHGSLRFGKVVFHRMPRSQEPIGQFSYLEPQTDAEGSEAGTFHCDMPVNEQLFDRWMASGILNHRLLLTVSFGFMPPAGLKYGAGPDGWEIQTWFVETNRNLLVTEFSLIVHPTILRATNDSEDSARGA